MTRKTTPGHIRISDEMYERLHPSAAPVLVGRSKATFPIHGRAWRLDVSPVLVEQMGDSWHGPVEFKMERCSDGRLDMMFRRLEP